MEEKDEKLPKRKVQLKRGKENKWELVRAKGFYPEKEEYTEQELKLFLKENPDIDPDLTY